MKYRINIKSRAWNICRVRELIKGRLDLIIFLPSQPVDISEVQAIGFPTQASALNKQEMTAQSSLGTVIL